MSTGGRKCKERFNTFLAVFICVRQCLTDKTVADFQEESQIVTLMSLKQLEQKVNKVKQKQIYITNM